eukprot:5767384-Prymnesium_polylepis.1
MHVVQVGGCNTGGVNGGHHTCGRARQDITVGPSGAPGPPVGANRNRDVRAHAAHTVPRPGDTWPRSGDT